MNRLKSAHGQCKIVRSAGFVHQNKPNYCGTANGSRNFLDAAVNDSFPMLFEPDILSVTAVGEAWKDARMLSSRK